MQSLWIYPEDTEVLGVACKSLLKALKPRYQKIALFSPIDGGREGLGECYSLNSLAYMVVLKKSRCDHLYRRDGGKLPRFKRERVRAV